MTEDNNRKLTADKFTENFSKTLDSSVLPARFAKDYHVVDCIKETPERSVYVIADDNDARYILKTGKNKRAESLWQEFHLNKHLITIPGLAIPESISCIETDEGCFLINSYIKGLNLVQYQEKHAPLSELDAVSLIFKMCHIVNILHNQNPPVIHRDIKPENFILEEVTGVLYLVDLDTGRQYLPKKERDTMFVGTFSQAAPEQFGFSQSDIRTDIYGLGKSMVYLLTGDASAENIQEYGISKELQKIVEKSTEFDPDKRYSNVKQIMHDLKQYQTRHTSHKALLPTAACAIIFLLAGLGAGFILGKNNSVNNNISSTEGSKTASSTQDKNNGNADSPYTSLRDQAGVYPYEPELYKEYYDALILDYYASDGDALARDCEAFVRALQQDKEINRIPGQDYSKLDIDEFSDFWGMDTLNSIRARLAYKDQMPYRQLGNYEKYKPYLLSTFGNYLGNGGGESFLASYARGEQYMGADEYTTYSCCMHDCLICIDDAFEQYYNFHGEE